jgi:hypothetical protein
MPLSSEENIVRAICTDKIDGGDSSPSLFKGRNTSVSRTSLALSRLLLGLNPASFMPDLETAPQAKPAFAVGSFFPLTGRAAAVIASITSLPFVSTAGRGAASSGAAPAFFRGGTG